MTLAELAGIALILFLRFLPYLVLVFAGYYFFRLSPAGRRLLGSWRRGGAGISPEAEQEFARLREELQDIHERLDFTERALAESRNRGQVSVGGEPSRATTPPEMTAAR